MYKHALTLRDQETEFLPRSHAPARRSLFQLLSFKENRYADSEKTPIV